MARELHLVACKTQQFGAGTDIRFFKTGSARCPVAVLDQMMALVIDKPRDSPLLPFSYAPLTASQFTPTAQIPPPPQFLLLAQFFSLLTYIPPFKPQPPPPISPSSINPAPLKNYLLEQILLPPPPIFPLSAQTFSPIHPLPAQIPSQYKPSPQSPPICTNHHPLIPPYSTKCPPFTLLPALIPQIPPYTNSLTPQIPLSAQIILHISPPSRHRYPL